ncbi:hypothetical protein STEG23_009191, partial [Scotinomys teguina]
HAKFFYFSYLFQFIYEYSFLVSSQAGSMGGTKREEEVEKKSEERCQPTIQRGTYKGMQNPGLIRAIKYLSTLHNVGFRVHAYQTRINVTIRKYK